MEYKPRVSLILLRITHIISCWYLVNNLEPLQYSNIIFGSVTFIIASLVQSIPLALLTELSYVFLFILYASHKYRIFTIAVMVILTIKYLFQGKEEFVEED